MKRNPYENPYAKVFPRLLVTFSLLSWLTSANGLYTWFADSIVFWLAAVIAMAASGVIQVAIAALWFSVASRLVPFYIKPLSLIMALIFSLFSGLLASGNYLKLFGSDDFETLLNRRSFASVATPLYDFGDTFRNIEAAMLDVAALSNQRADTEIARGDSCDGAPVQTGEGPRSRMRQRLQSEAAQMATLASGIASEAVSLVSLPSDVTDQAMREAYTQARVLGSDPRINGMTRWASQTLTDFEDSFDDQNTDQKFLCRDQDVEAQLAELISLLSTRIALPDLAPVTITLGYKETIRNSYSQIWTATQLAFGADVTIDAEALEVSRMAFAAALVVEFAIILFALLTAAMNMALKGARPPKGQPIDKHLFEDIKSQLDLLNNFMVEEAGATYFLLPKNGSQSVFLAARNLTRRWDLALAACGEAIDFGQLSPAIQQSAASASGDATHFTVYLANRKLIKFWRQAANDMAVTNQVA